MERLTFFENGHWCIRLNGVVYGDFPEVDRLASYEDTGLEPEEIAALSQADKDGRLVILEPSAKEGGKRPPCFYNDMGQDLCLGFGRGMEDDEPIDRCKECWYCEANRTLREEAEAALKKEAADNDD